MTNKNEYLYIDLYNNLGDKYKGRYWEFESKLEFNLFHDIFPTFSNGVYQAPKWAVLEEIYA